MSGKIYYATYIFFPEQHMPQMGEVFRLERDTENDKDANAIKVLRGQNMQQNISAGYIANSSKTVQKGTSGATSLCKLLDNRSFKGTFGKVVEFREYKDSAGHTQKAAILRLHFTRNYANTEEKRDAAKSYLIQGTNVLFPDRADFIAKVKASLDDGTFLPVSMDVSVAKGKIVVSETSSESRGSREIGEIKDSDRLKARLVAGEQVRLHITSLEGKALVAVENAEGSGKIAKFQEKITELTAKCLGFATDFEVKINFMLEQCIPGQIIVDVLNQYHSWDDEMEARIPVLTSEKRYIQGNTHTLKHALAYALNKKNVRLAGEKGAGKNTLVETVCWLMGRPLCRVQGSDETDRTDLEGTHTISEGTMSFQVSEMLRVLEHGGFVVLDEVNTVKPEVITMLHSLTDTARSLEIMGYGKITVHKDAVVFATMNEGYAGTREMNDATIDRFMTVILSSPNSIAEILRYRVPNAKPVDIQVCDTVHQAISKAIREGELPPTSVSIRGIVDALECVEYVPLREGLIDGIANKAQDQEERNALRNIILSF